MWTPRRILLLLAATLGLAGVYLGYAQLLGSVDGLPELPAAFRQGSDAPPPKPTGVSPTVTRLVEAFGPDSPEANDLLAYKVRIESRDKGIVFACGQPAFAPATEPSPFVTVTPVSVAFFGKPPVNPQSGEVTTISTIHSDSARLEYDRPVTNLQDMNGAKLVAMTLEANPNVPSNDPRRGVIEMTDNQRSPSPNDLLVVRTPGPVLYRDPDVGLPPGANPDDVPQIFTPATIEVVDRKNLPRTQADGRTATGQLSGDDLRKPGQVAAVLAGRVLPPPTVTATGLKIFLTPNDDKPGAKRSQVGYTGVRRMELGSRVQFNLWSDGATGFPGAGNAVATKVLTTIDRPGALGAALGGVAEGAVAAKLLSGKSLVVIETLGGFRYDLAGGKAEFETAASVDYQANHVAVTRLTPADKTDSVYCEKLEIVLEGAPGGKPAAAPTTPEPPATGPRIKSLTATGPHVVVSVDAEGLVAQGTRLHYTNEPDARRTVTELSGPQVAASRDRNRLLAGGEVPGTIVITTFDAKPGAAPESPEGRKRTSIVVNGPGSAELLDPETGKHTSRAAWKQSLTQDRVYEGVTPLDLLKFEGDASFVDAKADMRLGADRLWVWLAGREANKVPVGTPVATGARPTRLDATGNVSARSPELVIRDTNQLNLLFTETMPPANPRPKLTGRHRVGDEFVAFQLPAVDPLPGVPPPADARPAGDAKPAPKPPVVLSARSIDATLARYALPAPPPPKDAPARPAAPKYQYELDKALCVGRVVAHQDAADPKKAVRGLDIQGERLTLQGERVVGETLHTMVVTGTDEAIAQVFYESIQLFGPSVTLDQPRNVVAVNGGGSLVMPANQDTAGNATGKPNELEIRFNTRMRFDGALATAEFLGAVDALQQPAREGLLPPSADPGDGSWTKSRLFAHRLDVLFDKPVYFNRLKRSRADNAPAEPGPKLKKATGIPMPDDEIAKSGGTAPKTVTYQDESYDKSNTLLKAQRIIATELEVSLADRRQDVIANGPGEVRIMQPDAGTTGFGQPATAAPGATPGSAYKLTLAKFESRMTGVDKGKLFQQAVFANGARVWQIPTLDFNLAFKEHETPRGTIFLSAEESLEVSSSRAQASATAEQRMTARGNGEFRDDVYEGTAATIRYEGSRIVFEAGDGAGRFVAFHRRRRAVNNPVAGRAKTVVYGRDGSVTADGVSGGVFVQ